MTPESGMVMVMGQEAMRVALLLAAPMLLARWSAVCGSVCCKPATQITNNAVFIPKIIAVATTGIIAAPGC